jgi:hypothetical protein
MHRDNDPLAVDALLASIRDIYGSLQGIRIQGCVVTPDGKGDDGKTVRQHLEELKGAIDAFLAKH